MQANKRNRISFVRACSLVIIASVCLLLVVLQGHPAHTQQEIQKILFQAHTEVDNANGGTKKPSDFTITVSGNNLSLK